MLSELVSRGVFRLCHGSQLVYNTCWEDPRLDRVALQINRSDEVLVITSGGCNVLDYLLDEPRRVYAVDVNPRQNALLELKVAGIRALDCETFFTLFGQGYLDEWEQVYTRQLRDQLSSDARAYWDAKGWMFRSRRRRRSFYFRGSAGMFAWLINVYVDRVAKLREDIDALFDSSTLEEQREIYETRVQPVLWGRLLKWLTRRDFALAMLGVPRSQRRQIDSMYPGGVAAYIVNQVEELLTNVPLKDNYFWRVYIRGEYTRDCCPEYLKPENFRRLKEGLVDRVEIHTDTVFGFLSRCSSNISRFVLLDHMDWLYDRSRDLLEREWQVIVDRAAPETRVIWRSAAPSVEFVDPLTISVAGAPVSLGQLLCYDHELATHLHAQDRVHTYGSFYIARLEKDRVVTRMTGSEGGDREDEFLGNVEDTYATELVAHTRCIS